jgi:dTDP-4-dehydrorhamnose 3,5-epimerase
MAWIPPGFAHGFQVLSERADVLYKSTEFYFPDLERTVLWNDPDLNISWEMIGGPALSGPKLSKPTLSEKDRQGVRFRDAEVFD